MSRSGRAAARALLAGAACLLLTGCTEPDPELQRRIEHARYHNSVVGAAIALLASLAVRHVVRLLSARSTARRDATPWSPGPAPYRPAPSAWLVAAASVTEVLADGALLISGALIGWTLGPLPAPDPTVEGFFPLLVVLLLAPAVTLFVVAFVVQAIAARLPYAGVGTLVALALPHTALVLFGLGGLVRDHAVGGLIPMAVGGVGAYGFWREAARRR